MSGEPESLIHLRRLDAKIDRVLDEVQDIKRRVTAVDIQLGQVAANQQGHHATSMMRFDRLETRLDVLERRADFLPA